MFEPRNTAPHARLLTRVGPPPRAAKAGASPTKDAGTPALQDRAVPLSTRRVRASQLVVSAASRPLLTSPVVATSILCADAHAMHLQRDCFHDFVAEHRFRGESSRHAESQKAKREWRAVLMGAVFIFAFSYQIVFVAQAAWR